MPSSSENVNINPSENLATGSAGISPPITNNISGLTYGITYSPNSNNTASFSPHGLVFGQQGVSNAYASRVNGITDFKNYNDYIHYTPVNGTTGYRINVFNTLKKASLRFEIYSRNYR